MPDTQPLEEVQQPLSRSAAVLAAQAALAPSSEPKASDNSADSLEAKLQQACAAISGLTAKVAELERRLADTSQPRLPAAAPHKHPASPGPYEAAPNQLARLGPLEGGAPVETVSMAAARVVMHQIVMPSEVDSLGICFGGQVLSWIDICAGLAAKTVARGPCVTASVDSVHFLRPCRMGSVAIIAAMVNRTFASSMEVGVRVEEEDMKTGARHHCCSAYLTFVAVLGRLGDGAPARRLPRLVPTNSYHKQIHEAAEARRQERLAQRAASRDNPELAAEEARRRLQPITHREGSPTLAPAIPVTMVPGQKNSILPSMTIAHMTQLIMPQYANSLGITFGGQVMRWMEQCAYIAASRVGRGGHLLTGNMDSIAFTKPTRVGDIMYITAQVTGIFASSVEVMISVHGETPHVGEVFHCGDAFATVVSVDTNGNPVVVPFELAPESRIQVLRTKAAAERRDQRLRMRDQLAVQQARRPSLDGSLRRILFSDLAVFLPSQHSYELGSCPRVVVLRCLVRLPAAAVTAGDVILDTSTWPEVRHGVSRAREPGSGASLGAGAWSTGGFATPSTLVATAGGSIAADALYASGERDKAGSQPRSAADAMEAEADEPLRRSLYANNRDFQPEARELAAMLQCVDETQPAIPNPAGVVHLVEDGSNAMASPFASPDPMSVPGRSILRSLVAHPISVVSTSSMRSSLQVDLPPGEPQGISPLRSKPTQFDAQPAYASRPAAQQVQHAKPSNSGDSLIHDPKAGKQDPSHRTDQGSSSQEAGKLMWDDSALELDSPGDPDLAGKIMMQPSVLAQKRYSASRRSRSSTDAVSPQHPKDKQYTRAQQEFIARVKTDMSRPRPKSMSCAPGAYDTLAALDIRRDRRMDPRERTRLWLDRLEPLDDEILKRLLPSVSQPSSRPLKDISETNDTAEEVPVAVAVPVVTAREHNAKHGHRLHRGFECTSEPYVYRTCKIKNGVLWKGKLYVVAPDDADSKPAIPELRLHDTWQATKPHDGSIYELADLVEVVAPGGELPFAHASRVTRFARGIATSRQLPGNWYHMLGDTLTNLYTRMCKYLGACTFGDEHFQDNVILYFDSRPGDDTTPPGQEVEINCLGTRVESWLYFQEDEAIVIGQLFVGAGDECGNSYCYDSDLMTKTSLDRQWGWIRFIRACTGLAEEPPFRMRNPHVAIINRRYSSGRSIVVAGDAYAHFQTRKDYAGEDWRGATFSLITLEGLTLASQAKVFDMTDIVVAPHGAATANFYFLGKKPVIIRIDGNGLHRHLDTTHNDELLPNIEGAKVMFIDSAKHMVTNVGRFKAFYSPEWLAEFLSDSQLVDFLLHGSCEGPQDKCDDFTLRKVQNYEITVESLIASIEEGIDAWHEMRHGVA
ncbi:hypothetical protein WJX72_005621 [[Myrmecia] bisecta]|uniref:HotDog ACOT-type domain-containing protein n=1 Tax=[Myrmecia] bisecta TaxID=41462 RepID=A0AAW1Q009_9CHLO